MLAIVSCAACHTWLFSLSCWVTAEMANCTSDDAIAKSCAGLQQTPELTLAPRAAESAKLLGALGVLGVQGVGEVQRDHGPVQDAPVPEENLPTKASKKRKRQPVDLQAVSTKCHKPLKGVPPMIVGTTWAVWANTPSSEETHVPPLVLKYAECPRAHGRRLRRLEKAKKEGLVKKAEAAIAAVHNAMREQLSKAVKSRSGPSGWKKVLITREKQEEEKYTCCFEEHCQN